MLDSKILKFLKPNDNFTPIFFGGNYKISIFHDPHKP